MKNDPDFLGQVRSEVTDPRLWMDRAVVVAFALLSGLAVVLFTLLADGAALIFQAMAEGWWAWPLFWTPAVTALVAWLTLRFLPGAGGSGPPQVVAALDQRVPAKERAYWVSMKNTVGKIGAVTGGLLAGLSMGRQGPSVQIAAGVMYAARHFLSKRSSITARELLVAGGAAGIAAAFNTPLGGIVFAIEELSRKVETKSSNLMLGAIVLAGLVSVAAFGNLSYFGRIRIDLVGWHVFAPGLVLTLLCGLGGGLLARLLIASTFGTVDRFCALRRRRPVRFAAACGLAVAVIGVLTGATVAGAGHDHTRVLLTGAAASPVSDFPGLWTLLKLVATWLSAWSGVPGGLFGPALSIGASLGHDVAQVMAPEYATVLIALGMAGFLAAVTQTPITAMIIVMEMVDGYAMLLGLMAAAMLASLVSRTVSRPLYATLGDMLVQRRRFTDEPGGDRARAQASPTSASAAPSPAPATPGPAAPSDQTPPAPPSP